MVTVNNRYPLQLVSEMLDRVCEAKIFKKLVFRDAYNLIWSKEGDEYQKSFRMCYGQFHFLVMPFSLTNPPATFQSHINDCLRPYSGDFAVFNLDHILVYSTNEKENEKHVRQVVHRLKEFGLYCQTEKCQFNVSEVGFLGFVITPAGVSMESDRISKIKDWLIPKSVRDNEVLLGLTNLQRWLIRNKAHVTLPPTALLKKPEATPTGKTGAPWVIWE